MFFSVLNEKIRIAIYVKPFASKTKIIKVSDKELHLALHAKPKEGEANEALILWLSKWLKIPKTQIECEHGIHCRHKVFSIPNQILFLEKLTEIERLHRF